MICNNISETHDSEVIREDNCALFVFCKQCGHQLRIGFDKKGNPEHRLYGDWFKRDVLQQDTPLYYKYAGAKGMRVA